MYKKRLYWSDSSIRHKRSTKITVVNGYAQVHVWGRVLALIDVEDISLVKDSLWHVGGGGYAKSGDHKFMHRLILNAPEGSQVDHINGNKLDNRRSNLRLATASQNRANKGKIVNNTSGYKGVSLSGKKWAADIAMNKVKVRLGRFDTPEEAAKAYDQAARELHGEFARPNFPVGPSSKRSLNTARTGLSPQDDWLGDTP